MRDRIVQKKASFFDEKRRSVYLLSFLLPLILMVALLISKRVYPFGDKCILRTDFYHQYLPFYSLLQDKLKGFRSLFYTFEVGLGNNFITLLSYYLVCPLNILLLFIGKAFVLEYMTIAIVLKIALSGFTFAYYLVHRYKTDSFVVIFFALFYAMGGYMCAYYWNIMWLDNIVLFPILVHTFEKMYNGGKGYPYVIVLSLSILCNYYIGAITCIFLIVYFIFYSILREQKIKQILYNLLRTGIYSIIGVLISCILLLPIILAFKTTASSDTQFPSAAREYFSIIEGIGRMLPFVKVENGIDCWPNIYSGIFVFPLFTIYLLSKKVKLREKICYSIFVIFFIASFSVNFLDFIWHVCKFPNSLPSRQSFIFTFVLLSIAIKPLLKLDSIKEKDIAIGFAIPIVFIILIGKEIINEKVGFYSVYAGIIFLFLYMGLMLLYKNKKFDKNVLLYIVIVTISFEIFINMFCTSLSTINRNDYMQNVNTMRELVDGLKNTTDDFYRVEREKMKTKNDGAFIPFPSASIFSSSTYAEGTDFYKKYGMEASTNAYSTTGSTPFADSLLSIKYKLLEKPEENAKEMGMREIADKDNVYLYQNLYTLPFSYVFKNEWISDYDTSSGNPAIVQNNFSRLLKISLMLDKADISINGTEVKHTIGKSGDYYAFVRDKGIKELTVSFPNTTKTYNNLNRGYFIELGYLNEGDMMEFRNDTNEDDLLMELFRFDYDALSKVVDTINENYTFDLVSRDDSHIEYKMDSKIDGTCIVTLPYDTGFTLTVDGEKKDIKPALDMFVSFDITKGMHDIKLSYTPPGFYIGATLTFIGILLLIGLIFIENGKIKFRK